MNCGLCGKEIPADLGPGDGKSPCGSCRGGCRKIHCPYCGYANPAPGKFLRKMLQKNNEEKTDE
ncbi:hypothetical protein SAMN02745165_00319 [Malonomonas rubra DSM 5091]|uniref:Uncharacterized protein n=1 Tax=Malonomonas rubra DSM 5091 TaxID=1122189 RepID=A0A1M6BWN1_MALRU|nr:hypothetical protein SAMN02745165_00319 [Malonomonas rubra DSM 5091]